MSYALGVDLGTTYSAAAVAEGDRAEIFALSSEVAAMPSVVVLRNDGTVLTGEPAQRRAVLEPGRTAREFKRRLGDPTPILLGGTPYGAEALMAHLLRTIVEQVATERREEPGAVVLAHPANYGPYKLGLLEEAARLADVAQVELIPEPVAAALHYAEQQRVDPGEVVAVYDFGGGTFDATVLRNTEDGFELLGTPEGMERFGGIDLDEAVLDHVTRALGDTMDRLDPDEPATLTALDRLREECRRAKEALSADTDVTIPVMLPQVHTEVRLTRTEFEDMIRPRLRETLAALGRTVRSAGLGFGDLSRVLLVGGSSRMPLVAEMVREATGRPVALDAHPKHTVALGAAGRGWARLASRPTAAPAEEEPAEPAPAAEPPPEVTVAPAAAPEETVEVPHAEEDRRRRPAAVAALAAAVVVALGAGGFLLARTLGGSPEEEPAGTTLPGTAATAAATTVATTPPPSTAPPATTAPVLAYVRLFDDTGTISAEVPDTWNEINTTPLSLESGVVWPSILASPNMAGFDGAFDSPGLLVRAIPFPADEQTILDLSKVIDLYTGEDQELCEGGDREVLDGPAFRGASLLLFDCDGTDTDIAYLLANFGGDSDYLVFLGVQLVEDSDFDIYAHILNSLTVAG